MVASHTPLPGTCPTTQACALTSDQTDDPLVLRPARNSLSHNSQGTSKCFLIYSFLEWKGRRKKGRETSIGCLLHTPKLRAWPTTQARGLTGNKTSNLSVHRLALNPLSHTRQVQKD